MYNSVMVNYSRATIEELTDAQTRGVALYAPWQGYIGIEAKKRLSSDNTRVLKRLFGPLSYTLFVGYCDPQQGLCESMKPESISMDDWDGIQWENSGSALEMRDWSNRRSEFLCAVPDDYLKVEFDDTCYMLLTGCEDSMPPYEVIDILQRQTDMNQAIEAIDCVPWDNVDKLMMKYEVYRKFKNNDGINETAHTLWSQEDLRERLPREVAGRLKKASKKFVKDNETEGGSSSSSNAK
eukprot:TRINITY_DN13694_c0_g1_i1.p2 TRINITY_DN13694_c0_g1~~TRINITY_DN13694_c0_g1_i1.p2  ORF type:complete len:238 (+),score=16.77 TRINITY_DN13694_c0_g1_i1:1176-1889(+)